MNNKQEIHEESACGLSIRKISARSYMSKQSSGNEQTGILYWAQCRLADWRQETSKNLVRGHIIVPRFVLFHGG